MGEGPDGHRGRARLHADGVAAQRAPTPVRRPDVDTCSRRVATRPEPSSPRQGRGVASASTRSARLARLRGTVDAPPRLVSVAEVFVSYRTADARYQAADLADRLGAVFGAERVFRDADSLVPGRLWSAELEGALAQARVLVVLVGPGWLDARGGSGGRALERPHDWVRREIRTAFARGIPVVPVLFDDTPQPRAVDLPDDLAPLAGLQVLRIHHDRLRADVDRLAAVLVEHVPALLHGRLFEPEPLPLERPVRQPSALLRAEHEVVPFAGRNAEEAELLAWLDGNADLAAHLVTGPGGAGKTRLARRLLALARHGGWTAGILRAEAPADLLAGLDRPLLVVVDYAEARAPQLVSLIAALHGSPRARLLLLARSEVGWVRRLERDRDERVVDVIEGMARRRLAPLVPGRSERADEFDRAAAAFAPFLGPAHRTPLPTVARGGDALDVHAAALAALLDDQADGQADGHGHGADPVRRVLQHEERYWARTVANMGLPDVHDARLAQVVCAATLCGADDRTAARRLLTALPTFDRTPPDTVDRYHRWAAATYPDSTAADGLVPLRPDRLGEELVATVLADEPDLVGVIAPHLDVGQVHTALTVLSRAAVRHPDLTGSMAALLAHDPARWLPVALAVAVSADPAGGLPEILDGLLAAAPELATEVVDHIPDSSLTLAGLAVVVTRAALDRARGSGEPPERVAALTHNLAIRLDEVGRADDALTTAALAVARFRTCGGPTDLGSALSFLAACYSALGLHDDGLAPAHEAIELLRPFADDDGHRTLLATALLNAGNLHGDLGQHTRAEQLLYEAVALHRADVATGVDEDEVLDATHRLVRSLDSLGAALAATGRHQESRELAVESARLVHGLDDRAPDRFRRDLIRSLVNLSGAHAEVGDLDHGLLSARKAVELARTLRIVHGDDHLAALADALNNHGVLLRRVDRDHEALACIEEAVGIFRLLAAQRPGTELASLAGALLNLSHTLEGAGRLRDAFDAADEAVELYSKLEDSSPDVHGPDLALALRTRADLLAPLDDPAAALADLAAAITLLDELATDRRHDLLRSLAKCLHDRSRIQTELGRHDDAVRSSARAVGLYRRLPPTHRDPLDLVAMLHGHAEVLDAAERHREADAVFAEAAAATTEVGITHPDLLDRRAAILHDHALCCSALGDHDRALDLVTEAVALRRVLLDEGAGDPVELAESLNNLADTLHDRGDDPAALTTAREAVALCDDPDNECGASLHVGVLTTLAAVAATIRPGLASSARARATELAGDDPTSSR